ncbi:hypothetical protein IJ798_00180 [Candidatus Saccharibacteria bacterium]|nr:hypothetical protein [Candidatus Saccharibacteria bacterium]
MTVTLRAKWELNTLAKQILKDNGGQAYIASRTAPNFNTNTTTDEGVYSSSDYYGTTYYYRGAVADNCVYFAGFYWKIVRINGNGTTKIIFNGNSCTASGTDATTGTTDIFNSNGDNAYVGYMFGATNANSYSAAHSNINNSPAKTYLESWYASNISSSYRNYIDDVIFCNDRYVTPINSTLSALGYTQHGYGRAGSNPTMYNTYYRHAHLKSLNFNGCSRKDDRFTVSDTANGNGKLSYPIGLLDADEIVAAGVKISGENCKVNNENTKYYLYTGVYYHIMTPGSTWINGNSHVGNIENNGDYCLAHAMNWYIYFRPVINLKSSVRWISGDGTSSKPYHISI